MPTCLLRVKNSSDTPASHMLILPGEDVALSGPPEVIPPHAAVLLTRIQLDNLRLNFNGEGPI